MQTYLEVASVSGGLGCFPLPGLGEGWGHLHKENLCPTFIWIGGKQRPLYVSTFSQSLSAQNNHA